MKNNNFIKRIGLCYLISGIFILFLFFCGVSPSYALCQDDYVLANELIDLLRDYCSDDGVQVKNYWKLVHYLRTDWGNLSGFTLLEHFS